MAKILRGLKGVVCMTDDVFVFGEDSVQHWTRLQEVFRRIREPGMTLRKDKCQFVVPSVKFLGLVISAEGARLDPDKVQAICDFPPPANKMEGRKLMGMVNYLSKFSFRLAALCSAIHEVTGSRSEWFWGPAQ